MRGGGCAASKPSTDVGETTDQQGRAAIVKQSQETEPTISNLAIPPVKGLVAHDFTELFAEKRAAHLPGTREWAFSEAVAWLDDPNSPQLFWLMGGGGTGKSVLTAVLHDRLSERVG